MSENIVKKKLAYVDFWTHKDTKSGDFLREILSKEFEIVDFWWKPKEKFPLEELKKYENIFFFQVMFPYQLMKKLNGKKIMWAPMYDGLNKHGVVNFTNSIIKKIFWYQMSSLGVKILKFTNKIDESIGNVKLDTLDLKYYVNPDFSNVDTSKKKLDIFFWDRGGIKFEDWIKFFEPKDINEIVYFPIPDYGRRKSNIDTYINNKDLNITLIKDNFLTKAKFLSLISRCNVFISPRKKEGIGMTIVEAISKGMFVVGYNASTLNEYIREQKTGFLFDEKSINKIDINYVINNYEYRQSLAEKNYAYWIEQEKNILPFFNSSLNQRKKIIFKLLFLVSDVNFLLKKILKINYFY